MTKPPVKRSVSRAALGGALIAASFYATTHAHGAGPRPLFQATFPCGQVWDASTYEGHEAQNNAIDLAEWKDKKVTSMGQPVLASAAGTVKSSYIRKSDGEYRIFIDHGGGWETHYIHMQVGDGNLMKVGRRVARAGKWTLGWTHFLPFYLKTGGHPHAIVYKSASGRVGFLRLRVAAVP